MELSLVGEFADLNARINNALQKLYESGAFKDIEKEFDIVCESLPERYSLALDFELKLCDSKGRHAPLKLSLSGFEHQGKASATSTRLTTLPSEPDADTSIQTDTLALEKAKVNDYTVLRIAHDINDMAQGREIVAAVKSLLESGIKLLALSFSTNCYPYSRVLTVLAQCQKLSVRHEARVAIVSASRMFFEVLRQTRLDELMPTFKAEGELK